MNARPELPKPALNTLLEAPTEERKSRIADLTAPEVTEAFREFIAQPLRKRQELVKQADRAELGQLISRVPTDSLLDLGSESLNRLGPYITLCEKRERVGGKHQPMQLLRLTVREKPQSVRAEYLEGPWSGRHLLFDSQNRPDQIRVKEGGFLGVAGAIWLGIDSGLTRRDSNHPASEFGFGPLLHIFKEDFRKALPSGGFSRVDEGFDARGHWCMKFTAPAGAKGLYAAGARICFDLASALPMRVEVDDTSGPLESFVYREVNAAPTADFTTSP